MAQRLLWHARSLRPLRVAGRDARWSMQVPVSYDPDSEAPQSFRDTASQEPATPPSPALLGGDPGTPQSRGLEAGPMSPGSSVDLAYDSQRSALRSGIGRGISGKGASDGKLGSPAEPGVRRGPVPLLARSLTACLVSCCARTVQGSVAGTRRAAPGHRELLCARVLSAACVQGATAELSALMLRAKELIGMQEHSKRVDGSAALDAVTPTTARNTVLPDTLQPVQEDMEVRASVALPPLLH